MDVSQAKEGIYGVLTDLNSESAGPAGFGDIRN